MAATPAWLPGCPQPDRQLTGEGGRLGTLSLRPDSGCPWFTAPASWPLSAAVVSSAGGPPPAPRKGPWGSCSPSDSCSAGPTRPLLRLEWDKRRLPHPGGVTSEVPEGRPAQDPAAHSAVRQPQQGRPLVCLAPGSGHLKEPEGPRPAQLSLRAWLSAPLASPRPGQSGPCDTQPSWSQRAPLFVPTGSRVSRGPSEPQGPEQQARGGWEVRRDPLPDFSVPSPLEPSQEGPEGRLGKQGHPPGAWALQPEVSLATAGLFLWRRHWSCLLSCRPGAASSARVCSLASVQLLATPRTAAHQTPPFRLLQPQPPEGLSRPVADRARPAREVRLHPPVWTPAAGPFWGSGSGWVPLSLGCRPKPPPGAIAPPHRAPSPAGCRRGGEWAPSQAWAPGRGHLPATGGHEAG